MPSFIYHLVGHRYFKTWPYVDRGVSSNGLFSQIHTWFPVGYIGCRKCVLKTVNCRQVGGGSVPFSKVCTFV